MLGEHVSLRLRFSCLLVDGLTLVNVVVLLAGWGSAGGGLLGGATGNARELVLEGVHVDLSLKLVEELLCVYLGD